MLIRNCWDISCWDGFLLEVKAATSIFPRALIKVSTENVSFKFLRSSENSLKIQKELHLDPISSDLILNFADNHRQVVLPILFNFLLILKVILIFPILLYLFRDVHLRNLSRESLTDKTTLSESYR